LGGFALVSRDATPTASEPLLVLGSTGLLGQALVAEARSRGQSCTGVARSGSDHDLDAGDAPALAALAHELRPAAIVNCVAVTDLAACEADPALAFGVNARIPALLAQLARELESKLVHISSDHYFTGDGSWAHREDAEVELVNEYARSKYAGERLALTDPAALAVRTNIVGIRRWPGRPTFAEWALEAIESGRPMTLFDDFHTSSISARACAAATLDLVRAGVGGLVNVASREVASKRAFVLALARELHVEPGPVRAGSVRELRPRRAESLGLDVTRAQRELGRMLPDLAETVAAVVRESHGALAHDT
jgi:dTDP-4-dehydrorhamnose reductase